MESKKFLVIIYDKIMDIRDVEIRNVIGLLTFLFILVKDTLTFLISLTDNVLLSF